MKTSFKNYLKKKNAQEVIDKLTGIYKDKKIVLYGVNLFTCDLFKNYDLSKLNIIGISDRVFIDDHDFEYCGYKKIKATELPQVDFDVLLISAYDDTDVKAFLKKDLLKNKKIKIRTLIRMNFFEYVKGLINGEF